MSSLPTEASAQAAEERGAPPGPRGLPLVGNAPAFRRDQLGFLRRVQRAYGDAATVSFGRLGGFYLFSAPTAVERLLVSQAGNYTVREVNHATMPFLGDGLLNIDGEGHRRQRALVQPGFGRRRVEAYADTMLGYTEDLLARWGDGLVVQMHDEMRHLTLRIVARALLGLELPGDGAAFGRAFHDIINYGEDNPFMIPSLRLNLPFTAWGRFLRGQAFLNARVFGAISERRAAGVDTGDVLSTLVQAGQGGAAGSGALDDRLARDHVMTFLAAGHETTSNALTFTFHLLARNPGQRDRLLAELRANLGGRVPALDDLPRLPYLEAVVKESLRLYPPAWIMGRRAARDDVVLGYRLPAGAMALISQWVIHRLPQYWPEPERFLPERWLPGEGQRVVPYSYFPFGGGARTCIGMPFALQEAHLILATILQRFVPEALPGRRLALQPRVTLRPVAGTRMRLRRVG